MTARTVAVVTGAGSPTGIGFATARALARADGQSAQQLVARQRCAGALERIQDFAGVGLGRAGGALNGPGASVL